MKLILLFLCLVSTSCAVPLRKPRKAGFGSKSEEMMQFGPYGYMNSPQLTQLAASLYGYRAAGYPQMFPRQPLSPLQGFYLWRPQTPVHQAAQRPQLKPHQTPVARQPKSRPQARPQLPPQQPRYQQPQPKIQPPPKPPQNTHPTQTHQQVPVQQPKRGNQQPPQAFPPHPQQPWHFPQIFGHGGFQPQSFGPYQGHMPFGRPPASNEEGNPYFGYGYQGRPYYSEEYEDFEKPKEKDPPKATDPATNSTVSDTNSTISNPASQAGNATISGLSTMDNGVNSPGLQSKLLSGNGVPTPSPTVLMSGVNGAAQNGVDQSSHRQKSSNVNGIQSFPLGNQQPTGHGSHDYKPHPDVGDTRHNTLVSRGNPSVQSENPTYPLGYGENSIHRGNLQNTNINHPSTVSEPIPYGQQEHPHYSGRNSLGQRERGPFPSSDPLGQWNKDPVYRDSSLNSSPPEGHSLDPQYNPLGRAENAYNAREDFDRFQPSRMHQSNTLSHQGVFSATRRTPSETETHQYDWKEQSFNHPDREREQFPSSQNHMWNNQEDSRGFREAPPRYNTMYSSGSLHQRGHAAYAEKNSYGQRTQPLSPSAWEDGESSPTMGSEVQRESPSYSPALPSNQMQRNTYQRSMQQEHEPYPRQNLWTHENRFLDRDRHYRNPPYNPSQRHAYPKYSTENPANDRGNNLPYEEINQWTPEERSPVHGTEPLRHAENIPHPMSNMFGHRERNLQNQRSSPPLQSSTFLEGRPQYTERNTWVSPRVAPSTQKDTSPYYNGYSTDFRRNPTYTEDTSRAIHAREPISSVNIVGRRRYPETLEYPDDYPREHRTIISPSSENHLCCAGDSPRPRENILAPLRSAPPHFRLASWEHKGSSTYPEDTHAKNPRQVPYAASIQSNNSLKTGKMLPNQREPLGAFREEAAVLEKSPPCSNPQLRQGNDHEADYESGLLPQRNVPCYGSSIRGDGHNVLGRIVGTNQAKREFERAPLMLVSETFPQPQGVRSEALVSEVDRKEQQATLGFKRTPCFRSWLKQYLSSTGAPSGDQQRDLFYGEDPMPTGKPNILPPEPQPISSTNPSYDVEENMLELSSPGEEMAEQPNQRTPDCLLLQNK
ncbi:enamelin [Elgaria multicarinata webbii]|uniref:enamelin n=1 Tax=Elgaria multicarinata webbii TaxID=159646 RepID=UPI002FCD31EC